MNKMTLTPAAALVIQARSGPNTEPLVFDDAGNAVIEVDDEVLERYRQHAQWRESFSEFIVRIHEATIPRN